MTINEYCNMFGITVDELREKNRKKELVSIRKKIAFQFYKQGLTQGVIANLFDCSRQNIGHYISTI